MGKEGEVGSNLVQVAKSLLRQNRFVTYLDPKPTRGRLLGDNRRLAKVRQELGEMPVEFLLRDADAEVLEVVVVSWCWISVSTCCSIVHRVKHVVLPAMQDVPMQPLFPLSAEATRGLPHHRRLPETSTPNSTYVA